MADKICYCGGADIRSAYMLNKLTALLTACVAKLFDVVKCINK